MVAPAFAQQATKEAEIRRAVPYSKMRQEFPGITLQEYNDAVRKLAAQELATSPRPTTPVRPRAYSPPPVYVPSVPSYTAPRNTAPRSGSTIDPLSGNTYFWHKDSSGNTQVNGMNLNTGSMWQTEIKRDGSMNGWDKNFNPWTYDSKTKTYMNLGTGTMCIGEGYARICF